MADSAIPLAVLTIQNVDSVVSFDNMAYNVAKNNPSTVALINIVRLGATNTPCSVSYYTADGTAQAGVNYAPVSGTLTFSPGQTNKSVLIPIISDALITGNLTVQLLLTNALPTNTVTLGISNAVLTIIDNNFSPGELSFAATNYVANQAGVDAIVTVIRTNGFTGFVSVDYAVLDGTALGGVDYAPTRGTLAFASGETNKTFSVPILSRPTVLVDRSALLVLSNPVGGATLGATTNATLTIESGGVGASYFFFTATNYGVNEYDSNAVVTISRTNSRVDRATIVFRTSNGTAVDGINYLGTNLVVTFATNQSTTNLVIPILPDRVGTPDLTILLTLANAGGANGAFITQPSSTLTITNQEASFRFGAAAYGVTRNGTNAVLQVWRDGVSNQTVSVSFATVANSNALAGLDFAPLSGRLTWSPNSPASQTVTVPIFGRSGVLADVMFGVILTNPAVAFAPGLTNQLTLARVFLGIPSNTVVTIHSGQTNLAPAGTLDPTFNMASGANASVHAVAFDDQARLDAGGDFTAMFGIAQSRLSRLTTNGTVDTTLATGGGFDGTVQTVLPNGDEIIVGGDFTNFAGQVAQRLAVIEKDGTLSTRFNLVSGPDATVRALALGSLVSSNFMRSYTDVVSTNGVVYSDTNTIVVGTNQGVLTVNATFSPLYVGTNPAPVRVTNSLAIAYGLLPLFQTNVVVWSNFVTVNVVLPFGPSLTNLVVATNLVIVVNAGTTNGGPWSYTGSVTIGGAPQRPIYVGGSFAAINNNGSHRGLARLNSDGTLDSNFVAYVNNNSVYAIALASNGQVYIGGDFTAVDFTSIPRIARLKADGTAVDATFNPGLGPNGLVRALVLQPDGGVLIAGDFTAVDGVPMPHVARLLPTGKVDLSFDPGDGPNGSVYGLGLQDDGSIVLVGDFSAVGGNAFARVARLNFDGSVDISFNPGAGADALCARFP